MAYTRVANGDDLTPEQINSVYDSMEKIEAITAEAATLAAGSTATAEVQTDTNGNKKLALGLPQGATGATGANGTDGKSLSFKGEWNTSINYVNTALLADIVKKDGNVYICKQNNQGAPPPNTVYWDLFVPKGDDGAGSGNLKGTNVTALTTGKTYAIQAVTIPSEGGTLEGVLIEVASVDDVGRKLEKNFEGFYSEKTSLADNDLLVIQDSADTSSPKQNKYVKTSRIKLIKVNNATTADSATNATNATSATNVTTNINGNAISTIFESNGITVKNTTQATRATYASTDTSKGTIEERLTALGFKSGSINLAFGSATVNSVKRQGNYVIGDLSGEWTGTAAGASTQYGTQDTIVTVGTIPVNFRPKTIISIGVRHAHITNSYTANAVYGEINTSGVVTVVFRVIGTSSKTYRIDGLNFGFEANPL